MAQQTQSQAGLVECLEKWSNIQTVGYRTILLSHDAVTFAAE